MSNSPKAFPQQTPQSAATKLTEQEVVRLDLLLHLERLVEEAGPRWANDLMESSPEHAPEMCLIAQYQTPREFPQAILNSDSMHSLLSRKPEMVKVFLRSESFQEFLEHIERIP